MNNSASEQSGFEIGLAEELQGFFALRDAGALTEEEFQAQKARLLALGTGISQGQADSESPPVDGPVDLYLIRTGDRMIYVIKLLRELSNVGLAAAKRTAQSAPVRILEQVSRVEAERVGERFSAVGAATSVQSTGTPFAGTLGFPPPPEPEKPWYRRFSG